MARAGNGQLRRRVLRWVYIACGAACLAYYVVLGLASRFGLNLSGLWPALGAVLIAAGLLATRDVPRWLRVGWRALAAVALATLVALLIPVISGMHATATQPLEYLIVLGARVEKDGPSPALQRRLNAVTDVLPDHPDAVIIASGGQGADEPMSEAQCIRDALIARGVDPGRILLEDRSTTTAENLAFSATLIPDKTARAGIVTNNYHVWRAVRTARKAGLVNACGIAAKYTGWTKFHYMVREAVCIAVDGLLGHL